MQTLLMLPSPIVASSCHTEVVLKSCARSWRYLVPGKYGHVSANGGCVIAVYCGLAFWKDHAAVAAQAALARSCAHATAVGGEAEQSVGGRDHCSIPLPAALHVCHASSAVPASYRGLVVALAGHVADASALHLPPPPPVLAVGAATSAVLLPAIAAVACVAYVAAAAVAATAGLPATAVHPAASAVLAPHAAPAARAASGTLGCLTLNNVLHGQDGFARHWYWHSVNGRGLCCPRPADMPAAQCRCHLQHAQRQMLCAAAACSFGGHCCWRRCVGAVPAAAGTARVGPWQ